MSAILSFVLLPGVILVLAAIVAIVISAYFFVEDTFAERKLWGWAIVLPPIVGIVLWLGGRLISSWTGEAIFATIGLYAGVVLICFSPVVCVGIAVARWKKFRKYVLITAGSLGFLVVWAIVMSSVLPISA